MLETGRYAQVEVREESPVLLEGLLLSKANPVKQLAEQLDAYAFRYLTRDCSQTN